MRASLPELWVTRRTEEHRPWIIRSASAFRSSDSGDDNSDSGGDDGDSGADDDGDGNADGDGDSKSGKADDNKSGDSELQTELEKAKSRMKAADKRASDLEAELRKIQDKDKSELELAQRRVKELEEELAEQRKASQEAALDKALLTDPEFPARRWHDPEDVLLRAQRAIKNEDITVTDDGEIKGVGAWLKGLAKKSPHLLKSEDDDGDPEPKDREPSGSKFNGKKKEGTKHDRAKLLQKYPALRM